MSYRHEFKRRGKRRMYYIRFGHSLWSANQLPAQSVKDTSVRAHEGFNEADCKNLTTESVDSPKGSRSWFVNRQRVKSISHFSSAPHWNFCFSIKSHQNIPDIPVCLWSVCNERRKQLDRQSWRWSTSEEIFVSAIIRRVGVPVQQTTGGTHAKKLTTKADRRKPLCLIRTRLGGTWSRLIEYRAASSIPRGDRVDLAPATAAIQSVSLPLMERTV